MRATIASALALGFLPSLAGGARSLGQREQEDGVPESMSELNASTTSINIMVVWTRGYECQRSGKPLTCATTRTTKSKVLSKVDSSINNANIAFANSKIGATLKVVHKDRHFKFLENAKLVDDMNKINRCEIPGLCNLRDEKNAIITVAFTANGGVAGQARKGPDRRFRAAALGRGASDWTLAHEVGHLFGCRENRRSEPGDGCTSSNTWFGYRSSNSEFRDIMSHHCNKGEYDCSIGSKITQVCKLLPHYGDPDIWYNASTRAGVNRWVRTGSATECCACQMRTALPKMSITPTRRRG